MLREIIESQKKELEYSTKQLYIQRKVKIPELTNRVIKVVTGPRRSGKSFFSQHIASNAENFGYVNFDDERMTGLQNYDEITAEIMAVYSSPSVIFLDEIQNLPGWELWINRLQRSGLRIIISGSNANLLSSELSTHLTGRHERIVIFPFSYPEYTEAVSNAKSMTDIEKGSYLNNYIRVGGYPETTLTTINAHDYLITLFQSTIYKDIVKRHNIAAAECIENLGRYLISNTGSEYSFRSLLQVAGCKSDMTVRKYIRYLEESFLLFSVPRFSFKIREQAVFNKKVYSTDNGMINAAGFNTSPNTGRLAENIVAIVLEKKRLTGIMQYYFWKNEMHEEVDFLIMEQGRVARLIQVCWNIDNQKTANRELRALAKASIAMKCDNLTVITEQKEERIKFEYAGQKTEIQFTPLWKWLIEMEDV
jgi:predicted AAA+ superfamily ATPase